MWKKWRGIKDGQWHCPCFRCQPLERKMAAARQEERRVIAEIALETSTYHIEAMVGAQKGMASGEGCTSRETTGKTCSAGSETSLQ